MEVAVLVTILAVVVIVFVVLPICSAIIAAMFR